MTTRNGWGCACVGIAVLLALLSLLVSVNEYASVFGEELAGAYDCDGPDVVLFLLAPAVVLAVAGILVSARRLHRGRNLAASVAIAVGILVLLGVSVRVPPLVAELRKNAAPGSPCR